MGAQDAPSRQGAYSIALVTRRFGARFGGAEAYAEHLARALAAEHRVQVFCQEADSTLAIPVHAIPFPRWLPRWLNQVWFNVASASAVRRGFDIVHSHENGWVGDVEVVHVVPVRYSLFHRGRSLARRLGVWLSPRLLTYLALERLRFRTGAGRRVVAPARQTQAQVAAAYPRWPAVPVIPPGVTLPLVKLPRAAALAELGLPPAPFYGLLVANDPRRKGWQTLCEAFAQLAPDHHLIVVGGSEEAASRLRDTLASGMRERVHVFAGRPDLSLFYSGCDLYLHPTLEDSFGMAPLEAMSYGVPVVLSSARYCGFAAYLEAGRDAWVLEDPRDARALAGAVSAIREDAALREALSARGLAVAARFTWSAVAASFVELYAQAQAERASP